MRVKRDYVLFSVMHLGDHRLWPSGHEIEGNTKGISGLGFFRFDDVNHSFFLDERSSKDIFKKMSQVWLDPRLSCAIAEEQLSRIISKWEYFSPFHPAGLTARPCYE